MELNQAGQFVGELLKLMLSRKRGKPSVARSSGSTSSSISIDLP
jgi:hypothetical protein